jgi:uroporphyrinogen decarboxylase
MNARQWQSLLEIINGKPQPKAWPGFIIDSPWLPGWFGISIFDYFCSERCWFDANMRVIEMFPDVMFFPGFWSEFGMCTEPSAFGSRLIWQADDLPFAEKMIHSDHDIDQLINPNVESDGLLPFVVNRLQRLEPKINQLGHQIYFAISRGPLNIASFLMESTAFLTTMVTDEKRTHQLLENITDFIIRWVKYQKKCFPSIDGILILDDIVGFIGKDHFEEFAMPYLQHIFQSLPVHVKFLHNDAQGLVCAPFLDKMGVNLFNFSYEHDFQTMKDLAGKVTLVGNLPPRDVLAQGTPDQVAAATKRMYHSVNTKDHIIWSCGGGMPPNVSTDNIRAFVNTITHLSKEEKH